MRVNWGVYGHEGHFSKTFRQAKPWFRGKHRLDRTIHSHAALILEYPRCGSAVSANNTKCEDCGMTLKTSPDGSKLVLTGCVCPQCGKNNKDDDNYCTKCGKDLRKFCILCKKRIPLDAEHCPFCGKDEREAKLAADGNQAAKNIVAVIVIFAVLGFCYKLCEIAEIYLGAAVFGVLAILTLIIPFIKGIRKEKRPITATKKERRPQSR